MDYNQRILSRMRKGRIYTPEMICKEMSVPLVNTYISLELLSLRGKINKISWDNIIYYKLK